MDEGKMEEYEKMFKDMPEDTKAPQVQAANHQEESNSTAAQLFAKKNKSSGAGYQPKQAVQQQQQKSPHSDFPAPQQHSLSPIEQMIQQYSQPQEIYSGMALKLEKDFWQARLQKPDLSADLKQIFGKQVALIDQTIKSMMQAVGNNTLDGKQYIQRVAQALNYQKQLLLKAQQTDTKIMIKQIEERIKIIQKELDILAKDNQLFKKVLLAAAGIQSSNFNPKAAQGTNSKQIQIDIINSKPIREKIQLVLIRDRQYQNLAEYLAKNFPDNRKDDVEHKLAPVINHIGKLKELLKQGINEPIGEFFVDYAPEPTPELLHGCNDYDKKIEQLINEYEKSIEEENQLQLLAIQLNAKSKTGENFQRTSKNRTTELQKDLHYLKALLKNKWSPIPVCQTVSIKQEFVCINEKCDSGKYCIQYSLNTGSSNVETEETPYCDKNCVLNYEKTGIEVSKGERRDRGTFDIHTKKINIKVMKKGLFGQSDHGTTVIDLAPLANNPTFEGTVDINYKNHVFQLEFGIYIRESVMPQIKTINSISMVKRYEQFDLNKGVNEYVKAEIPQVAAQAQPKIVVQEKPKPDQLFILEHADGNPLVAKIKSLPVPSCLTAKDLVYPDYWEKCKSGDFYAAYIPLFKQFQQKCIETNMFEEKKLLKESLETDMLRLQNYVEKKLALNKVPDEEYIPQLQQILERDALLMRFYAVNNLQQHYAFTRAKYIIVHRELNKKLQGQMEIETDSRLCLRHTKNDPEVAKLKSIPPAQYEQKFGNLFDLVFIESPDKYFCYSYVEALQKSVDQSLFQCAQASDESEELVYVQILESCIRKKTEFMKLTESESFNPESYAQDLKNMQQKDIQLEQFFRQVGANQRADFLAARIAMVKTELDASGM